MAVLTTSMAVNYFVSIDQLTAHNTVKAEESTRLPSQASTVATMGQFSPFMPFVLFGLLFCIALGIQLTNRFRDSKHILMSVLISFAVASIPAMLAYVGEGGRQQVTASPQEIPKHVVVQRRDATSVFVTWNTDAPTIGVIRLWGTPPVDGGRLFVANKQAEAGEHTVLIDGLTGKNEYQFQILSGTTWYDNNGQNIRFTF